MPTPETPSPTIEREALLRQLELVDENENPIERFFQRERLLERLAAVDETARSPE